MLGAAVLAVAACSGGSSHPPAAVAPPAPGHDSPQAAVAGFMDGLPKGAKGACFYVAPQEILGCAQAFTSSTSFSFNHLAIGEVAVRGSQALVTVTGSFCARIGGTTTCSSNTNVATGQPHGGSASAFDAAYSAGQSLVLGKRAIPCTKVSGLWYVNLAG